MFACSIGFSGRFDDDFFALSHHKAACDTDMKLDLLDKSGPREESDSRISNYTLSTLNCLELLPGQLPSAVAVPATGFDDYINYDGD